MLARTTSTNTSLPTSSPEAIRAAFDWFLKGHADQDILEAIAEKFPGQPIPAIITAALDQFRAIGRTDEHLIRGWCREAARELYRNMVEIGDFGNALKALKQLEPDRTQGPPAPNHDPAVGEGDGAGSSPVQDAEGHEAGQGGQKAPRPPGAVGEMMDAIDAHLEPRLADVPDSATYAEVIRLAADRLVALGRKKTTKKAKKATKATKTAKTGKVKPTKKTGRRHG